MSTGSEEHIGAVMTASVETIAGDASVREASRRMRERNINSLLVPGAEAGIVTSTDVLDAVADGRDLEDCRVADVMTVPVESVTENLRVEEAAAMMTNYGINHLPVRDRDGDYVGIVSSTDLKETIAASSA